MTNSFIPPPPKRCTFYTKEEKTRHDMNEHANTVYQIESNFIIWQRKLCQKSIVLTLKLPKYTGKATTDKLK